MAKKKFEMKCEVDVMDIRGREVCPGNIVAVSRSGSYSKSLDLHIITSVSSSRVTFGGFKRTYDYVAETKDYNITESLSPSSSYTMINKSEEILQQLVVIDNPLYAISNPEIEKILRIADSLKSSGIFPCDYKFGESIMTYDSYQESAKAD